MLKETGAREFIRANLEGHSQLAHIRIRYHFIVNLHITRDTIHTVFN